MGNETVATAAAQGDTKAAQTVSATQTTTAAAASGTTTITVDPKAETKVVTPAKERISMAADGQKAEPAKTEAKTDEKSGDVKVAEGEAFVYDLKMPDGSPLDPATKDEVAAFAKEHKLAPEIAQKILERDHKARMDFLESNKPGGRDWSKRADVYEQEALDDPEIGGTPEKLKASAEMGRRMLEKYFGPEVKQFLIESGLGSNKHVIRGFVKMFKAHKNDSVVVPGAQGGPSGVGSLEDMY